MTGDLEAQLRLAELRRMRMGKSYALALDCAHRIARMLQDAPPGSIVRVEKMVDKHGRSAGTLIRAVESARPHTRR